MSAPRAPLETRVVVVSPLPSEAGAPLLAQADELARDLNCALLDDDDPSLVDSRGPMQINVTPRGLILTGELSTGKANLFLDFTAGALRRRLLDSPSSLVVKALGKSAAGTILDVTAGLLRDSLTVAGVATRVVAVERDPVVAALAADALRRAAADERLRARVARVDLKIGEGVAALEALSADIDGVIIDPMFSEQGSAAPKKDLALLQRLLSSSVPGAADQAAAGQGAADQGAADLVAQAVKKCRRVVVKRGKGAASLLAGVNHTVAGKGFRWDVYTRGS